MAQERKEDSNKEANMDLDRIKKAAELFAINMDDICSKNLDLNSGDAKEAYRARLQTVNLVASETIDNIHLLRRYIKSMLNKIDSMPAGEPRADLLGDYEIPANIKMRRYSDESRSNFVLIRSPPDKKGRRRPVKLQCCLFIAAYYAALEELGVGYMTKRGFTSPWSIFLVMHANGVLNNLKPNSMPSKEHIIALAKILQVRIEVETLGEDKDKNVRSNCDAVIGTGEYCIRLQLINNHYLNFNDSLH